MRVVWDPEKARENLRKHGVRFSDAEGVLFDPLPSPEKMTNRGVNADLFRLGLITWAKSLWLFTPTEAMMFA